jgi:hypothetical protein
MDKAQHGCSNAKQFIIDILRNIPFHEKELLLPMHGSGFENYRKGAHCI